MRRRQFITLLVGAAAWPLTARAQQPAMPVIGFLHIGDPGSRAHLTAAFRLGLEEAGYIEGQNVAIDYRWAEGQLDRLPSLAADLVRRQVSVIAAPGSRPAPVAAKAATTTIPIVFAVPDDPVKNGLVGSLNRPGGNATGIYYLTIALAAKRLGLLHELAPKAAPIGVLVNRNESSAASPMKEIEAAANILRLDLEIIHAGTVREIDAAFASLANSKAGALLLINDPLFFGRRVQIVTLANRFGKPAMFTSREFAEAGGLMSYGTDLADVYRRVGVYTGQILKGARPAEMPVVQPVKFEFLINLNTARALGLEIPPTLLARADEVIE
jgi:putative ABC transport system substrate-binding protein